MAFDLATAKPVGQSGGGFDLSTAKPVADAPKTSILDSIKQGAGNLVAGAVRGAGSIGATILYPVDKIGDFMDGGGLGDKVSSSSLSDLVKGGAAAPKLSRNEQRRADMDAALKTMGADPDSTMYAVGKVGGEIAGTAGAGGVAGNALARLVQAPRVAAAFPTLAAKVNPLIQAVSSSGMTTGVKVAPGAVAAAKDLAVRSVGSGVAGAVQAGVVDPNEATSGGVIGLATPGVLKLAGAMGSTVYNAVKGGKPNTGRLLADALGVDEAGLKKIVDAANAAPDSIVDGSKLTLGQALQQQGANIPEAKMLERIVAGGPGGDKLLKQYQDQATARMTALQGQGAETYMGAAREEATKQGDKIGAVLRTQAGDDKAAARAAWEAVHGRAAQDGVSLQLPLQDMEAAMGPLGRGSVVPAKDARNVLQVAKDIGTEELPAVVPLKAGPVSKSQSLEQAVRAAGGIRGGSGELRDLGIKQSGTTGLINNKTGREADLLAEEMHRRGFIPDADPATLFDALRNGGGRKLYANDQVESNALQRMAEAAMGDAPEAERIAKAVPFAEFQRLRRDSGSLAAKAGERAGGETEAGVLAKIQELLTRRADDAANGMGMEGDNVTPEFLAQYNRARGMTKANAERYKGGNNITSILRKPVGQEYTLNGDEIANKLWHGGAGLAGDVTNLKQVLSGDNFEPTMNALRKLVLTDAASKTTASGNLGSALPRYVESRMPGLQEALTPEQLNALTSVAGDIRNSEAAAAVNGLRGSDTQAKISRALDAGLLDSPLAKAASRLGSVKGIGIEPLRNKMAEAVIGYKGRTLAQLLADPKAAAAALQDQGFTHGLDAKTLKALEFASGLVSRGAAPALASP